MRNIHPAAWVGIALNFLMGWFLFAAIDRIDLNAFPSADREAMEAFIQGIMAARPIFMSLLAGQALALGLIAAGNRFGLPLSVLAGLLTLPGSIIYMIGCALSNGRMRYADFTPALPGVRGAFYVFPSSAVKKTRVWTAAFLIGMLAAFWVGAYDAGIVFCSLAAGAAWCMWRAAKIPVLALYERHFTLTPVFFARSLLIPYDSVEEARLFEEEESFFPFKFSRQQGRPQAKIRFRVETGRGARDLDWPLERLVQSDQGPALRELGDALALHGARLI
ncbi:MAG: hypothetical protein LBS65_00090 [Desulfovibrio sp.]|jgi:hypothetical protein|nr:hypothetical protein [Desulfovibrio sp.]